jgi:hypothetical protein
MRTRLLTLCFCVLGWLSRAEAEPPLSHPVVGISFALSDHTIPGQAHTFVCYEITKSGIGWSEWIEPGDARSASNQIVIASTKSGHIRDTNAVAKAAQTVKLLKALAQPKHLPASAGQVLTARWLEGNKVTESKFPTDQVPSEIHQALLVMRCPERDLKRLTFIQAPATNGIPPDR